MSRIVRSRTLVSAAALAASLAATAVAPALAQQAPAAEEAEEAEPTPSETIVVRGEVPYRNRSDTTEPTLNFGQEYFQPFEPLTVGDALKRTPSVAFLSDVIEADGVRLRGLDPGYTQILIDGERVPGGQADRSFFVDRIPAELIDRIEIVRSSSARRSGDAIAGALNIVLRDGYALDGGFFRVGGLRFSDSQLVPALGAVYGGELGPGRILIGANLQGRRNPKDKLSFRYSQPPADAANFVNREDQSDLRSGVDTSVNLTWTWETEVSELELGFFYVGTTRTEDERSREYNVLSGGIPNAVRGPATGNLLTDNAQIVDIEQDSYAFRIAYEREMLGGEIEFRLGHASFTGEEFDTETEIDFDRSTPRFTGDRVVSTVDDVETSASLAYEVEFGDLELEVGLDWQLKSREQSILSDRNRFNRLAADRISYLTFQDSPTRFATPFDPLVAVAGGVNEIEETRLDPFVVLNGEFGAIEWEAGVRLETTSTDIFDATAPLALQRRSIDTDMVLPSAHLKWELSDDDRVTFSVARTVRRPSFNFISPATLEAELGDNDLVGNPDLQPETAWGADLGFERRLGRRGVAGINLFYRDVTDLIEVANTGVQGSEGAGTFVLTPRNTGDGSVWGVELDLSTPLSAFGLENTGVFFNYSWLDSEVSDFMGTRRFNDQAESVMNVGFIQDLPDLSASFGATYRVQGDAFGRIVGEEITTSYGGELEIFLERRFGDRVTVRFVGSNLLDSSKDEVFDKFVTIADQISRSYDEFEIETEDAGPVFQLMTRVAF